MNPCHNASNSIDRHQKQDTEKSGHRAWKTRRTGGVLFERVWFSEGVGMERVKVDAGDKRRGTGHMTGGVHGVHRVPKAAAKTAETSVLCP
jgi:hypothetical protein